MQEIVQMAIPRSSESCWTEGGSGSRLITSKVLNVPYHGKYLNVFRTLVPFCTLTLWG